MRLVKNFEQINLSTIDLTRLRNLFSKLTSKEIEVFLDLLNNLDIYKIKIENLNLEDENLKKYLLINLALINESKTENSDIKSVELNIINSLKSSSITEEERQNIFKGYIVKGFHVLFLEDKKNKIFDEFKYKKLVLKYFHDIGGFQPGIWGVNINFDVFNEFINNIDDKTLEKLENKNKIVTIDDFIMLRELFEK